MGGKRVANRAGPTGNRYGRYGRGTLKQLQRRKADAEQQKRDMKNKKHVRVVNVHQSRFTKMKHAVQQFTHRLLGNRGN